MYDLYNCVFIQLKKGYVDNPTNLCIIDVSGSNLNYVSILACDGVIGIIILLYCMCSTRRMDSRSLITWTVSLLQTINYHLVSVVISVSIVSSSIPMHFPSLPSSTFSSHLQRHLHRFQCCKN